jgi:hypothetical protein
MQNDTNIYNAAKGLTKLHTTEQKHLFLNMFSLADFYHETLRIKPYWKVNSFFEWSIVEKILLTATRFSKLTLSRRPQLRST